MSLISIGKRIGDLDIRLGIPPSKPQFSTREANRRISANNTSSNANSVYNVFRSGMTTAGGFARPTQFLVTIDGPKGMLAFQMQRLKLWVEQPFIWCLMRGHAQRVRLSALMGGTTFWACHSQRTYKPQVHREPFISNGPQHVAV